MRRFGVSLRSFDQLIWLSVALIALSGSNLDRNADALICSLQSPNARPRLQVITQLLNLLSHVY